MIDLDARGGMIGFMYLESRFEGFNHQREHSLALVGRYDDGELVGWVLLLLGALS